MARAFWLGGSVVLGIASLYFFLMSLGRVDDREEMEIVLSAGKWLIITLPLTRLFWRLGAEKDIAYIDWRSVKIEMGVLAFIGLALIWNRIAGENSRIVNTFGPIPTSTPMPRPASGD